MKYTGCYDTVMKLVDEVAKKFADTHVLNERKVEELRGICDLVDAFALELEECNLVNVAVNTDSKQLFFNIESNDIILEDEIGQIFFKLIQKVDSFAFFETGEDRMCVSFNVDGIWTKSVEYVHTTGV